MKKIRKQRETIGDLRLKYEAATGQKKLNLLAEIRIEENKMKKMLNPEKYKL